MATRVIGSMVVALCFASAGVGAAAPPTTTPPAAPVPAPAPTQQPTGLGTDARMDLLAAACFNGTMQACDDLYDESPLGSAYEAFADTCAGRQPAGSGRYCSDVFTDTVAQPTAPTTAPPPTTSVLSSTTTVSTAPPVPPTNPDLASRIPAVDGYSVAGIPVDDVLWRLFDDSLPGELTRHHTLVVAADGAPVAHLVVAAATAGERSAIDAFVEHTFADVVFLPTGSVETDDGVFTTMNSAVPLWIEMEGNAVIVAEQQTDGNFQWAWSAADAVWIVRGTADAEAYVRVLLRLHAASLDPYDQQGMTGDLFDHTPTVPGFQYWDRPRASTVASLSQTLLGNCVERFYSGYVLPDGATGTGNDPADLQVALIKAAGRCVEDGSFDEVAADVASATEGRTEVIGGVTVHRDDQNVFFSQGVHGIIAFVGDVVIVLATRNPQTFVDRAPFIEQFLSGQPPETAAVPASTTTAAPTIPTTTAPPTTVVDIHSLTVGQCLLGAELVDGDIGDGLIEVVDCSLPHHAEVFHVSAFEDPAGAPYPGDEQARNTTLARCHPAFDAYVGQIWAESRLGFTYVYPFDFEWEANDRLVLCYLWDRLGQTLTGSMAGTGE
jgi:hypothetical protein